MKPKPGLYTSPARPPLFPNLRPEDLDIKDSMVFEGSNPHNCKMVREEADAFWALDPPIVHPPAGTLYGLTVDGKPHPDLYAMARQAHFIEFEVDTETGKWVLDYPTTPERVLKALERI